MDAQAKAILTIAGFLGAVFAISYAVERTIEPYGRDRKSKRDARPKAS